MYFRLEILLVACALAFLPIPWLSLVQVESLAIKVPQICILLLGACSLSRSSLRVVKPNNWTSLIIATMFGRIVLGGISLSWAADQWVHSLEFLRVFVNFLLFIVLVFALSRFQVRQLALAFGIAALTQPILTTGLFVVAHVANGSNPVAVVWDNLLSPTGVKREFYWMGLRFLGVADLSINGREISANTTNAMGSCVLLTSVIYLALRKWMPRTFGAAVPCLLVIGNTLFIIIWGGSERVHLLSVCIFFGFMTFVAINKKKLVPLFVVVPLCFGIVFSVLYMHDFWTYLTEVLDNPRRNDLSAIVGELRQVPVLGNGYGVPIGGGLGIPAIDYRYAHNIFLSDYYFLGIIGILTSVGFVIALTRALVRSVACWSLWDIRHRPIAFCATICFGNAIMLTQITAMGQLYLLGWCFVGVACAFLDLSREPRPTLRLDSKLSPGGESVSGAG